MPITTLVYFYIFSFISTFLALHFWKNFALSKGIVGKDMNKYEKPAVAESAGIPFFFLFLSFSLVFSSLFFAEKTMQDVTFVVVSVLLCFFVGIIDDLTKDGLTQKQKPLLTFAFSYLPAFLYFYLSKPSYITIPFLGNIDFGLLYFFLVLPLGITGASNAFNMYAGFNGLETSNAIIITATATFMLFLLNNPLWQLSLLMLVMLFAIFYYNAYPSKLFVGDSFTYAFGAFAASLSIIAKIEFFIALLFTLHFIDFFLAIKKSFKVSSFAIPNKDNSLMLPKSLESTTHLLLALLLKFKKKVYEKDVVSFSALLLSLISLLSIYLFLLTFY